MFWGWEPKKIWKARKSLVAVDLFDKGEEFV